MARKQQKTNAPKPAPQPAPQPASQPAAQPRWLIWAGSLVCLAMVPAVLLALGHGRAPRVPVDAVMVASDWADETTCAGCHEQGETFWETGHASTLRLASAPESLDRLALVANSPGPAAEGTSVDGSAAINRDGSEEKRVQLDWCFGSGTRAFTWASTMPDSLGATDLLEFRWSWYRQGNQIALTPAHHGEPNEAYYGKLGEFFDGPKARRCFSCHAGVVPGDYGRIDQTRIHAGVTCQRCHGPKARHVASDGEYQDPNWKFSDRLEQVHRCAQCHRRAEEQEPAEIRSDNIEIVRFQPVGLVQSKCFQESQMSCTTCHDPHRTFADQDSRGIWQCTQCHDPHEPTHVTCGAGERDSCLQCHMPALPMDAPLEFTDHWIRVRKDRPATP